MYLVTQSHPVNRDKVRQWRLTDLTRAKALFVDCQHYKPHRWVTIWQDGAEDALRIYIPADQLP